MSRHPCFICEDRGSFDYAGVTHACDCDAARRMRARTAETPTAQQDPLPLQSPSPTAPQQASRA